MWGLFLIEYDKFCLKQSRNSLIAATFCRDSEWKIYEISQRAKNMNQTEKNIQVTVNVSGLKKKKTQT